MKILKPNNNNIKLAVRYLREGKAVVYPTDTAYGLGVDATNEAAVKRLYQIKGRSFKKPVHVVVADLKMAKKYVRFDRLSEKLFKKFMPGPLTIVLKLIFRPLSNSPLPPSLKLRRTGTRGEGHPSPLPPLERGGIKGEVDSLYLLSAGTSALGIRVPDNTIALQLVKKHGRPITATSANVADQPTCYDIKEIVKQFVKRKYKPDLIIDAGKLPKRKTSTVVRVENGRLRILRQGPIYPLSVSPFAWGRKTGERASPPPERKGEKKRG